MTTQRLVNRSIILLVVIAFLSLSSLILKTHGYSSFYRSVASWKKQYDGDGENNNAIATIITNPPKSSKTTITSRSNRRRNFIMSAATMITMSAIDQPVNAASAAASDDGDGGDDTKNKGVISSKYCAYGTGDGCDDLADGNEFIKMLQERSAANKESTQTEAKNAYYMKNYPDWFASVGKNMIKNPDGTFTVVDDAELKALKDANKLSVEYVSAMAGKTRDMTQKPILVLKE